MFHKKQRTIEQAPIIDFRRLIHKPDEPSYYRKIAIDQLRAAGLAHGIKGHVIRDILPVHDMGHMSPNLWKMRSEFKYTLIPRVTQAWCIWSLIVDIREEIADTELLFSGYHEGNYDMSPLYLPLRKNGDIYEFEPEGYFQDPIFLPPSSVMSIASNNPNPFTLILHGAILEGGHNGNA